MVAFFEDGDEGGQKFLHLIEGGRSPMPADEMHMKLATSRKIVDEAGGEDVSIS